MNASTSWRRLAVGLLGSVAYALAAAQMDTPAPPGPPAAQSVQRPPPKALTPPPPAASAGPLQTHPPTHPGDPQISVPLGKPAPLPVPPASAPDGPSPPALPADGTDPRGASMASCDRLSGKAAVAECRRRVATQGGARPTPP
ncbi:hypothetical protein [Methylibium sp.]|jgi:hypothetical protein|uniref:hypothetical protein n=1 Tax=Methylibium sp. TaxID=2067992 RepID=UPI003D1497BC